jgi:predicted ATP-binding protein involved in virulence
MISNKIIEKEFLMELVYLWVKNYKNIVDQGFNFSPRFRCEYDEDTKELNIVDKEETGEFYPKNFFGDNINVTAIVGENGSGKSSILTEILKCIENRKNIFLFHDKNLNQIFLNTKLSEKSKLSSTLTKNNINTKDSFFYHYKNDVNAPILENRYARYNEEGFIFTEPNKSNNVLDIKEEETETLKKLIDLVHDNVYEKIDINKFFVPRVIVLEKDEKILKESLTKIEDKYLKKYENMKKFLDRKELLLLENILYFHSIFKTDIGYFELKNNGELKFNCDVLSKNKKEVEEEILRFHSQIILQSYEEQISLHLKKNKNLHLNVFELNELKRIFNLFKKIDEVLELLEKNADGTYSSSIRIDKIYQNDNNRELLQNLPKFLKVEFTLLKRFRYSNLSSGERIFLEILYSVRNIINLREKNESCKNIFILIDEVENSLHPEWQKKLIIGLFSFLKIYQINIHIIIATHSPFILSDLPKENIIFLEKGKQVYPFEDGKQTFGANIHTLLSHGFFMKDGLMGEFAKSKIDDVIKYLNNDKRSTITTDEDAQNIINIIGEPIIKRELQRMLKNKMELSNKTEIDKIREKVDKLTKELEESSKRLVELEKKEDK